MKTTKETSDQGKKVFMTGQPIEGVKEPLTLSQIVHNFAETTVIDLVHCVFFWCHQSAGGFGI